MTVRFVRPVSTAAYAAKRLALGALMLLAIAVVAHRFGPLATPHFIALTLLSGAIAAVSLPFALRGLLQLWQHGAEGGVASTKALIYALPPLALVLFGGFLYQSHPRLYDVTTDPDDPPAWRRPPQADQLWLSRPPIATLADRRVEKLDYPALTGRRYEGALDRVYEAVMTVAKENRIALKAERGLSRAREEAADREAQSQAQAQVESEPKAPSRLRDRRALAAPPVPDVIPVPLPRPDPAAQSLLPQANGDLLLQGATRTLILGLPFDVAVRLREEEETTLVDVRVAASYGAHDLGLGADIAETFLRALDAELLGIAAQ